MSNLVIIFTYDKKGSKPALNVEAEALRGAKNSSQRQAV